MIFEFEQWYSGFQEERILNRLVDFEKSTFAENVRHRQLGYPSSMNEFNFLIFYDFAKDQRFDTSVLEGVDDLVGLYIESDELLKNENNHNMFRVWLSDDGIIMRNHKKYITDSPEFSATSIRALRSHLPIYEAFSHVAEKTFPGEFPIEQVNRAIADIYSFVEAYSPFIEMFEVGFTDAQEEPRMYGFRFMDWTQDDGVLVEITQPSPQLGIIPAQELGDVLVEEFSPDLYAPIFLQSQIHSIAQSEVGQPTNFYPLREQAAMSLEQRYQVPTN